MAQVFENCLADRRIFFKINGLSARYLLTEGVVVMKHKTILKLVKVHRWTLLCRWPMVGRWETVSFLGKYAEAADTFWTKSHPWESRYIGRPYRDDEVRTVFRDVPALPETIKRCDDILKARCPDVEVQWKQGVATTMSIPVRPGAGPRPCPRPRNIWNEVPVPVWHLKVARKEPVYYFRRGGEDGAADPISSIRRKGGKYPLWEQVYCSGRTPMEAAVWWSRSMGRRQLWVARGKAKARQAVRLWGVDLCILASVKERAKEKLGAPCRWVQGGTKLVRVQVSKEFAAELPFELNTGEASDDKNA